MYLRCSVIKSEPKEKLNIDEYRDLNGRYNTASGATDDFDIDSGLKKVNIGWTSASVSTVRGGTLALPASIDTIELN